MVWFMFYFITLDFLNYYSITILAYIIEWCITNVYQKCTNIIKKKNASCKSASTKSIWQYYIRSRYFPDWWTITTNVSRILVHESSNHKAETRKVIYEANQKGDFSLCYQTKQIQIIQAKIPLEWNLSTTKNLMKCSHSQWIQKS